MRSERFAPNSLIVVLFLMSRTLLAQSNTDSSQVLLLDSSRYEKRVKLPLPATKKRMPSQAVKIEKPKSDEKSSLAIVDPVVSPVVPSLAPPPVLGGRAGMQEFFLGGNFEEINQYRTSLDDNDTKRNVLEISFAPTLIYNDSKSISWYRNYNTVTPSLDLNVNFWVSPLFGITAGYTSTFSGSMNDSMVGSSNTAFVDDWTTVGVRVRRFYDEFPHASSSIFGLSYRGYSKKVPGDNGGRLSLKSKMLVLSFDSQIEVTKRYSWNLGVEFVPYGQHEEIATGVRYKSGDKGETFAVGASVGGEYLLDRTNRFYWKLSQFVERNIYSGPSVGVDPVTSTTLTGVSVTNSFTLFSIGHIWGF